MSVTHGSAFQGQFGAQHLAKRSLNTLTAGIWPWSTGPQIRTEPQPPQSPNHQPISRLNIVCAVVWEKIIPIAVNAIVQTASKIFLPINYYWCLDHALSCRQFSYLTLHEPHTVLVAHITNKLCAFSLPSIRRNKVILKHKFHLIFLLSL